MYICCGLLNNKKPIKTFGKKKVYKGTFWISSFIYVFIPVFGIFFQNIYNVILNNIF